MTTIPSTRGPFMFDAPYNNLGIRITQPSDGTLHPRNYAYWPNINAQYGRDKLRVFVGTVENGPIWFWIDKCTHVVQPMGLIFPSLTPGHPLTTHTTEGWYWSERDPNILYCSDDEHLYRYNFETQILKVVADITELHWVGRTVLRQWHSSGDGKFHSATIKEVTGGSWPNIGTAVCDETAAPNIWRHFPKIGDLDESQIDRDRKFLLIKENVDGLNNEDNRIIDLTTGVERVILDEAGAGGHSDNGYGYMVHADNWQTLATWRATCFDPGFYPQMRIVMETSWEEQIIHVSHCNARPGSMDAQYVVGSGTIPDIVAFRLDGLKRLVHLAPSMSAGGDYDNLPKANIDPGGEWAFWLCYREGRFDAFMVKIPVNAMYP